MVESPRMEKKYLILCACGLSLIIACLFYLFFSQKNPSVKPQTSIRMAVQKTLAAVKLAPRVTEVPDTSISVYPSPTIMSALEITPKPRVTLSEGIIIPETAKQQAQNITQATYTHPQLQYSVKYPSNWKAETADAPYPDYDGYLDANIFPFGNQTRINQYQSTPDVAIRAEDTDMNLQSYFESDPLGKQHAEKTQDTIVAGVPAIIYDWSFDSSSSQTTVLFIKNGKAYKIQLTWSSEQQKSDSLDDFALIYQSFSN